MVGQDWPDITIVTYFALLGRQRRNNPGKDEKRKTDISFHINEIKKLVNCILSLNMSEKKNFCISFLTISYAMNEYMVEGKRDGRIGTRKIFYKNKLIMLISLSESKSLEPFLDRFILM